MERPRTEGELLSLFGEGGDDARVAVTLVDGRVGREAVDVLVALKKRTAEAESAKSSRTRLRRASEDARWRKVRESMKEDDEPRDPRHLLREPSQRRWEEGGSCTTK